jgi:hypothetical protein
MKLTDYLPILLHLGGAVAALAGLYEWRHPTLSIGTR